MGSNVQADVPMRPDVATYPGRILAAISAGIAFVMVVVYLLVIRSQGDGMGIRVFVVSSCIAAAGACAAGASWSSSPQRRLVLMAAAAGGLISLGIIGMWSIGFPLFVAGVLMTVGSLRMAPSVERSRGSRLRALVAGIMAFLLPVAILFTPR